MCIDDWRIGRLISSTITIVTLSPAATAQIQASPQRIGIAFGLAADSIPTGGDMKLSCNGIDLLTPELAIDMIRFDLQRDGQMPTFAWTLTNGGAVLTYNISVVQHFLPESVLQAALESYQREYGKW